MTQVFLQQGPLNQYLEAKRNEGQVIGFVPTMGALHQGHSSLLNVCRAQNHISVCSIFVNPTQFNRSTDFSSYPRTPSQDIAIAENAAVDVLFMPKEAEMYATGEESSLNGFDLGYLDEIMEGTHRPGHFSGVATIVKKLLDLVKPHKAYFGQKDYQQLLVVKKLVNFFNMDIEIIGCKTVREPSGLAMSSRNMRLNEQDKQKATDIFRTLQQAKKSLQSGEAPESVEEWGFNKLNSFGFDTDYFKVAETETLKPAKAGTAEKLIICTAATIGGVRLIDNILVHDEH